MLAEVDYSGVVINTDNDFDYLPLLKVIRKMTAAPIGVSVLCCRMGESCEAAMSGVDIYRERYDTPESARWQRAMSFSAINMCVIRISLRILTASLVGVPDTHGGIYHGGKD